MSKWIEDLNHYISLAKDKPYRSLLISGTTSMFCALKKTVFLGYRCMCVFQCPAFGVKVNNGKWMTSCLESCSDCKFSATRKYIAILGPVSDQSMDQSDDSNSSRNSLDQTANRSSNQQRTNTTMHVCWHRNTSVSADDYFVSLQVRRLWNLENENPVTSSTPNIKRMFPIENH